MHLAFLNPQGNFDPADRYWTRHADFGGQLVYVKEVAMGLARLGHQVDILTRQIIDPDWIGFEREIDAYPDTPGVRILRIPCGPSGFLRKEKLWPHLGQWVDRAAAFYQSEPSAPSVWTGHYADGALAGAMLSRITGHPFTMTGHSLGAQKLERMASSMNNLAILDTEYHFGTRITAERVAMSRANRIIVSTREEQRTQYGHRWYRSAIQAKDNARFAVIPPGVNVSLFGRDQQNPVEERAANKIEQALARDISPDRRSLPCIVASARLEQKKNHIGLVQAFALDKNLQRYSNLLLAIRGLDQSLETTRVNQMELPVEAQTIIGAIQELGEKHHLWGSIAVVSLEGQAELAAAYRHLVKRRSVFCLPAFHEPFGLAPLEAMAAGLPVISTRFGGPSESMVDANSEFGVLVDPRNPIELANGLLRLVSDPAEWAKFHEAGYRRVIEKYTWDQTSRRYAELCLQLQCKALRPSGIAIPAYFYAPDQHPEPPLPA